jgi:acetyl esterase/lipase
MGFFKQLVMGGLVFVMAECPLPGQQDGKAPLEFEGATAHVYKKTAEGELYLYVFQPQKGRQQNRPAAVFFFGGGWNGGTPKQFEEHASYLASRGMVGIVADYRVKSRQGTTPFECVKDGKSAIRWVRVHAGELGIDPDRIAAGGGSAGGHVAAATATVPGLEEKGEDSSVSCRPNALLLFNPVYDNGPEGYGHGRVKERYKEISPIHNIHKGTPPAIVFLGTKDTLIPVATAEKYKQLMEQAGSRCDLHLYEGQPHGFFNRRKSEEHFLKTVTEMDRFLESLGYLKGEPTIK